MRRYVPVKRRWDRLEATKSAPQDPGAFLCFAFALVAACSYNDPLRPKPGRTPAWMDDSIRFL